MVRRQDHDKGKPQQGEHRGLDQKVRTAVRYDSATTRALAFRLSFISPISLATSSMNLGKHHNQRLAQFGSESERNWIIKSTILCFNIVSEWKLVIKNDMTYPCKWESGLGMRGAHEQLGRSCQRN